MCNVQTTHWKKHYVNLHRPLRIPSSGQAVSSCLAKTKKKVERKRGEWTTKQAFRYDTSDTSATDVVIMQKKKNTGWQSHWVGWAKKRYDKRGNTTPPFSVDMISTKTATDLGDRMDTRKARSAGDRGRSGCSAGSATTTWGGRDLISGKNDKHWSLVCVCDGYTQQSLTESDRKHTEPAAQSFLPVCYDCVICTCQHRRIDTQFHCPHWYWWCWEWVRVS